MASQLTQGMTVARQNADVPMFGFIQNRDWEKLGLPANTGSNASRMQYRFDADGNVRSLTPDAGGMTWTVGDVFMPQTEVQQRLSGAWSGGAPNVSPTPNVPNPIYTAQEVASGVADWKAPAQTVTIGNPLNGAQAQQPGLISGAMNGNGTMAGGGGFAGTPTSAAQAAVAAAGSVPAGASPGGIATIPNASGMRGYTAQTDQIPFGQTVQGLIGQITNQNSPLMAQARTAGNQEAARRGLLDSTMGIQAAQSSVLNAASPIAQADAQLYQDQRARNQSAVNTASQFGAGEANKAVLQNLDSNTKKELAQIEANYKTLMQVNATAGEQWNTFLKNVQAIEGNKDMKPAAKEQAINNQLQYLTSGLNFLSKMNNMAALDQLLDFGIAPPGAAGGGTGGGSNLGTNAQVTFVDPAPGALTLNDVGRRAGQQMAIGPDGQPYTGWWNGERYENGWVV